MSKSLESMLNNMYSRPTSVHKHITKSDCIFSNEMVQDIKKIKSAKTVSECDFIHNRLSSEARTLNAFYEQNLNILASRKIIANQLATEFTAEAARYWLSLEEGEQTEGSNDAKGGDNKIKAFASNVWDGIKKIVQKIVSALVAFGKAIVARVNELRAKTTNGLYKNFKPEEFKNVDATIKAVPLPKDVLQVSNMDGVLGSLGEVLNECEKALDQEVMKEANLASLKQAISQIQTEDGKMNPKAYIYKTVWGSDKRPESKEMKISEYLNCQAGQKPQLLEMLSENSLKDLIKIRQITEKSIKVGKKFINELNKAAAKTKTKDNKEEVQATIKANNEIKNNFVYVFQAAQIAFNESVFIRMQIASAVRKGLGKVKGGDDSSNNNAANADTNTGTGGGDNDTTDM